MARLCQEIVQQLPSLFRQYGFRMELHALDRQGLVPHAHDGPVVGPCGDLQHFRQRVFFDHERVVARGYQRLLQTAEHASMLMMNQRHLPVHDLTRVHDASPKSLSDALVAEAYAKNRKLSGETLDQRYRYPRLVGRTGPRRYHDMRGLERFDFRQRDLVVAEYRDLLLQFAEILDEVVGERIVVVYHQ